MSLKELYQEIILDHGKCPRNCGRLEHASHHHRGHNPLCGDQLMLYVMAADNKISDIRFEGSGCAISIASASLMSEAIKGKAMTDVNILFENFHHLVTGQSINIDMGKLAAFSGVAEFPIRVKCATLAWHTLKAALSNEIQPVSTES
jgi:nitrogen fixation NifU-like protein